MVQAETLQATSLRKLCAGFSNALAYPRNRLLHGFREPLLQRSLLGLGNVTKPNSTSICGRPHDRAGDVEHLLGPRQGELKSTSSPALSEIQVTKSCTLVRSFAPPSLKFTTVASPNGSVRVLTEARIATCSR
jgi:hypothetical protein